MNSINENEEANIRNTCPCTACVIYRGKQNKKYVFGMDLIANEEELPVELKFELDKFCSSLKRSPYAEAGLKRNFAKKIRRFIKQALSNNPYHHLKEEGV